MLIKNWLVAEFGSPVRAMAMVPTLFFKPLYASLVMALSGGFLYHILGKSAALNHKIVDNAVENRVVVKTFFGVIDKVCHGFRCFDFIQLQLDVAHIGFNHCMGNRLRLHGK